MNSDVDRVLLPPHRGDEIEAVLHSEPPESGIGTQGTAVDHGGSRIPSTQCRLKSVHKRASQLKLAAEKSRIHKSTKKVFQKRGTQSACKPDSDERTACTISSTFATLSVGDGEKRDEMQGKTQHENSKTKAAGEDSYWIPFTLKVSHFQVFEEYILKKDNRTSVTFESPLPDKKHPRKLTFFTDMRAETSCEITMVDVAASVNNDVVPEPAETTEVGDCSSAVDQGSVSEPGSSFPFTLIQEDLEKNSAKRATVAGDGNREKDLEMDSACNSLACLWCGCPISASPGSRPVGCPVDWMPAQIVRTSFSEVGRDDFTMKENVTSHVIRSKIKTQTAVCARIESHSDGGHSDVRPAHYKTRWAFDNMNCMLAFAMDRKDVPEYALSISLAHKMYDELFPGAQHELKPAPHWSLLKRHGGFLTKHDFDKKIGAAIFVDHGSVELPVFKPYGKLVSTKLCFTPESSAARMMIP